MALTLHLLHREKFAAAQQPGDLSRDLISRDHQRCVKVDVALRYAPWPMTEFLQTQLPPLDVMARDRDFAWSDMSRGSYDLVIDATGEEAFSIALNAHAVEGRPDTPPVLFVWLAGNGAAARAILTGSPDRA